MDVTGAVREPPLCSDFDCPDIESSVGMLCGRAARVTVQQYGGLCQDLMLTVPSAAVPPASQDRLC
jgi:hypothetical protein